MGHIYGVEIWRQASNFDTDYLNYLKIALLSTNLASLNGIFAYYSYFPRAECLYIDLSTFLTISGQNSLKEYPSKFTIYKLIYYSPQIQMS